MSLAALESIIEKFSDTVSRTLKDEKVRLLKFGFRLKSTPEVNSRGDNWTAGARDNIMLYVWGFWSYGWQWQCYARFALTRAQLRYIKMAMEEA